MWADRRFLSHSTLQIVQHSGNKKKLKWIFEIVLLFDNIVCQPLVIFSRSEYSILLIWANWIKYGISVQFRETFIWQGGLALSCFKNFQQNLFIIGPESIH